MVASAEKMIGHDWMKWLRGPQAKGAFGVEAMAENVGRHRWYDTVYRTQSRTVHAADALWHLEPGTVPTTIDAHIVADGELAAMPLHLAIALFGETARLIDWRFGLRMQQQLKELADGALAIMRKSIGADQT
jgi:hypothetical protein